MESGNQAHTHIHTDTYIQTHRYIHKRRHAQTHTFSHINTDAYTRTFTYLHTNTHKHAHTHKTYTQTLTYPHQHTNTRTHTHTHTHTHMASPEIRDVISRMRKSRRIPMKSIQKYEKYFELIISNFQIITILPQPVRTWMKWMRKII